MSSRRRRTVLFLGAATALFIGVAAPAIRTSALQAAGWALVHNESLEPADAIVVVVGGDRTTLLEAADLVEAGISKRVDILLEPPDAADRELARRGVQFEDETEAAVRLLHQLGVPQVAAIPKPIAGTEAIGRVLPEWCDTHHYQSIALITPSDHSKRTRRVLDRAMTAHPTTVRIRTARYSAFDPDRWWRSRDGVRTGVIELQKLLLDYARHPL